MSTPSSDSIRTVLQRSTPGTVPEWRTLRRRWSRALSAAPPRQVIQLATAVVKALSWALRSLVPWDRAAVTRFLAEHDGALAARVKREVRTKLRTGRKNGTATITEPKR